MEGIPMYHPSSYKNHNRSLKKFAEIFNELSNNMKGRFKIEINKDENFIYDGIIHDKKTGKKIFFDWEKRQSHYINCGFPFPTFGQFERKIETQRIDLSIQCSKEEDCFCIAWHSDFEGEPTRNIPSITEEKTYEYTGKRFSRHFLEINYKNMEVFHRVLEIAFDDSKFNKESFHL